MLQKPEKVDRRTSSTSKTNNRNKRQQQKANKREEEQGKVLNKPPQTKPKFEYGKNGRRIRAKEDVSVMKPQRDRQARDDDRPAVSAGEIVSQETGNLRGQGDLREYFAKNEFLVVSDWGDEYLSAAFGPMKKYSFDRC